MKFNEIHMCLDCDHVGRLHRIGDVSQCPKCASRATWPVASWSKPALMALPFHEPKSNQPKPRRPMFCDLAPTFLGGSIGNQ